MTVILLDAARADAFSPFGGEYTTPGLERLAGDGTKFTRAISTSSWTGQSVPSIFTGLFADTLGIGGWGSALPTEPATLAELLAAAGYRTVLWSQHPIYRNRSGLQRGFEEVVISAGRSYDHVPGPDLLFDEQRPTFTWLHFIPPHTPYRPPGRFLGSYSSWYEGGTSVEASFLSQFPHRVEPDILGSEDRRYIRDRYLENAAFADELVQRVVDLFDQSGRYDDSMIVVLSDHGEAFLEHDRFLHTRHVYREFLHVPWIIKWPFGLDTVDDNVDAVVPLTDLVPTLVDGLGLEVPGPGFQGQSLLPLVLDGLQRSGPVYAETRGDAHGSKPPLPESMLEVDGWRIVYDALADRSEIYRSHEDPLEQSDLARTQPMRMLQMRQAILRQMTLNRSLLGTRNENYLEPDLDTKTIEQLRALGYLDGTSFREPTPTGTARSISVSGALGVNFGPEIASRRAIVEALPLRRRCSSLESLRPHLPERSDCCGESALRPSRSLPA
ncbi:MAG: sulfatase, partial [Acidobacteriota bacterium]